MNLALPVPERPLLRCRSPVPALCNLPQPPTSNPPPHASGSQPQISTPRTLRPPRSRVASSFIDECNSEIRRSYSPSAVISVTGRAKIFRDPRCSGIASLGTSTDRYVAGSASPERLAHFQSRCVRGCPTFAVVSKCGFADVADTPIPRPL
jgi:hypothetical protein